MSFGDYGPTSQPTIDEAAQRPQTTTATTATTTTNHPLPYRARAHPQTASLRQKFHSECLVSWIVLRKTTCPICRTAYIFKEDMKVYKAEDAAMGMWGWKWRGGGILLGFEMVKG